MKPSSIAPPRLRGKWSVVYHIDDAMRFAGKFTVEDEDGVVVAVVPFGTGNRLGYVAAEQLAKAIAEIPQGVGQ